MKIEIYGGSSVNKGAYLMILAAQKALSERYQNAVFAIDPGEGMAPQERALRQIRYVYSLEPLQPRLKPWLRTATLLTDGIGLKHVKKQYGLVTRSESAALIDISGYRYGDFWGERTIRNFTKLAAFYHKKGKPVIMLPQMFGPFEKPAVRAAFGEALKYVTKVYARDAISYQALANNFDIADRLHKAPDFTVGLKGDTVEAGKVAYLVPNSKVFAKADVGGERYLASLQTAYETFRSYGLQCRILLFDTAETDKKLLQVLLERLQPEGDDAVVTEADPLRLKAMLGAARIIFSSRFHACICGLSSLVPVLTYGWAHKYEAMHADFDVSELIVDAADPSQDIIRKTKLLMEQGEDVHQRLQRSRDNLTAQTRQMWQDVFAVLDACPHTTSI